MNTSLLTCVIFIVPLSGCDILSSILPQESERERKELSFKHYEGDQFEIKLQRYDVFNDVNSLNVYLTSFPSITGLFPNFDESSETLISVLSYMDPCYFVPKATSVIRERFFESNYKINVNMINQTVVNGDSDMCRLDPRPRYYLNIIVIDKTDEAISLVTKNDNYVY